MAEVLEPFATAALESGSNKHGASAVSLGRRNVHIAKEIWKASHSGDMDKYFSNFALFGKELAA